MAAIGRPPEPARLKLVKGRRPGVDSGGRPIKPTLLLPPGRPSEPKWSELFPGRHADAVQLRADARAEWRRVAPVLDGAGVLAAIDGAVLADYCACWAQLQQCLRVLAADGPIITTERGRVRHPATIVAGQLRQAISRHVTELGLGPVSRARLNIPPDDDDDPDGIYDT